MKKKNETKILKKYTKFTSKGKQNIEISNNFYDKILYKIEMSPKKLRKWIYNRLAKYKLVKNNRSLFVEEYKNINIEDFDPLKKIFYRYNYCVFMSQSYYKLTDYQLELFRRVLRQKCGKQIVIDLKIQNFYNVLRRPNQMRMGGGKGSKFYKKVFFIYPGFIFIELRIVRKKKLLEAYKYLVRKVPFDFKVLFLNRV